MWLAKTIRILPLLTATCLPLGMSACGFQPMYAAPSAATQRSVEAQYKDIEIANIPDNNGQYLRNALIDRLYVAGRPADARYLLEIAHLKRDLTSQAVQKDATYTRSLMEYTAMLRLRDRKSDGAIVLERNLRALGSYNLLDNQFATISSRDSLNEHLLDELADSIQTALALHFRALQTDSGAN